MSHPLPPTEQSIADTLARIDAIRADVEEITASLAVTALRIGSIHREIKTALTIKYEITRKRNDQTNPRLYHPCL